MTPGHDASRTVVASEVDEHDHRGELEFRRGLRHVTPYRFVAMQPLFLGARSALQQVPEVQLIPRACGRQDPIAEREQQRVTHDVDGERPRNSGHPRHLFGERAVERLHDRVEQRLAGIGCRDRRLDLFIDPVDDVETQETLDDHRAVAIDRRGDRIGLARSREALEATVVTRSGYCDPCRMARRRVAARRHPGVSKGFGQATALATALGATLGVAAAGEMIVGDELRETNGLVGRNTHPLRERDQIPGVGCVRGCHHASWGEGGDASPGIVVPGDASLWDASPVIMTEVDFFNTINIDHTNHYNH